MASQKNKNLELKKKFLDLAFEQAKINLGKTKLNPSGIESPSKSQSSNKVTSV